MTRRELLAAFVAALVGPHLPAIAAPAVPMPLGLFTFLELPGRIHSLTVVQDRLFCFAGDGLYEIFNDVLDRSWMRYRLISKDYFQIVSNGGLKFAWSAEDGVIYDGPQLHMEAFCISDSRRPDDFNL